jgi:6-pyruvoyltetrahydropterin/6-carboxytetrahydropterin synthase
LPPPVRSSIIQFCGCIAAVTRLHDRGNMERGVQEMASVKVTKRLHFAAAHRLRRDDWSDERNRSVFGLCSNPNWHGHNYELDVTIEGEIDPETGFVIDLGDVRQLVESRVIEQVDHRNLNLDVEWMRGLNPTTENLVVAIWQQIVDVLPSHVRLARLVLWETPRNYVEYTGDTT